MKRGLSIAITLFGFAFLSYALVGFFFRRSSETAVNRFEGTAQDARSAFGKTVEGIGQSLGILEDTCRKPLAYAVGTVDPRFQITNDEVKKALLAAEAVWENASGEDLLRFDEQSSFRVGLVFDERQQQTIDERKLRQDIGAVADVQRGLSKDYDTLLARYEKKRDQYASDGEKYQRLFEAYQQQVKYWNNQGGAPSAEYAELQKQKRNAEALARDMEKQRKSLNAMADQINALVKKEKLTIDAYDDLAATYTVKYGGAKEFDQGVYTGSDIKIFQFADRDDLVLVLAHEFGHALGLDHANSPQSLMYYLMDKQDVQNPKPTEEDLRALRSRCD